MVHAMQRGGDLANLSPLRHERSSAPWLSVLVVKPAVYVLQACHGSLTQAYAAVCNARRVTLPWSPRALHSLCVAGRRGGATRCAGQVPVTELDVTKFRASLSSPFVLHTKVTYQDSVVLISDGLSAGPNPLYVLPTAACAPPPPAHKVWQTHLVRRLLVLAACSSNL